MEAVKWTIVIPDFVPPRVNQWRGRHWSIAAKLKRELVALLGGYARLAGVIAPEGKRRLSLTVTMDGRGRFPDPDSFLKLLLDAAKICGLIVDDSQEYVEWSQPVILRSKQRQTVIELEDVP